MSEWVGCIFFASSLSTTKTARLFFGGSSVLSSRVFLVSIFFYLLGEKTDLVVVTLVTGEVLIGLVGGPLVDVAALVATVELVGPIWEGREGERER